MYEHRSQPLLPRRAFLLRLSKHGAVAMGLLAISLAVGMVGYHLFEKLHWIDAFLNTAMLLGGMGPVDPPKTLAGKLFAGLYALYAGLVVITVAAILGTPIFHRVLHHFHADADPKEGMARGKKMVPKTRGKK
ncbi:MAG TPA: hypothetical protein VLV54_14525 [Thermoanaerobaculia bacterium]|nr:hypothetical protein [Thermoanaerobaculia bacterium]